MCQFELAGEGSWHNDIHRNAPHLASAIVSTLASLDLSEDRETIEGKDLRDYTSLCRIEALRRAFAPFILPIRMSPKAYLVGPTLSDAGQVMPDIGWVRTLGSAAGRGVVRRVLNCASPSEHSSSTWLAISFDSHADVLFDAEKEQPVVSLSFSPFYSNRSFPYLT